jgi:hypothetical protein
LQFEVSHGKTQNEIDEKLRRRNEEMPFTEMQYVYADEGKIIPAQK